MIYVPTNLPCAYEVKFFERRGEVLITKWLVPGGDPVYVAAIVKDEHDETFWTCTLAEVQKYVAEGKRTTRRLPPNTVLLPKPPTRQVIHAKAEPPILDFSVNDGTQRGATPEIQHPG